MPTQHSKLAGDGNGRNLMATTGADADEKGAQRTSRLGGCPGRFDQHGAGMAAPHLADATVLRKAKARLANSRIKAEITDELLWRGKASDIADRGHQPSRHNHVHASDGDQPLDCRIAENGLRHLAVEQDQVLAQAIELAHMTLNRRYFIRRQRLAREPLSATTVEEIRMRAARDQVRVQDCVDLVLDPGSMLDDLIAARDQTAQLLGVGIGCPNLWQEAGRIEVRQNPGVDLVRFDMRVGDRLDLQWIGDDHARD
jgi:hypothetical protein